MNELELVVKAARDKEHRTHKFMAALKGVDLDNEEDATKERFEQVQRRAQAKLSGKTERELEFNEFGLDLETE